MEAEEVWRAVPGYNGLYEISSLARVRSLPRIAGSNKRESQVLKGRVLKPGVASTGYLTVALCKDGKPTSYTLHSLIAAAFIGPRPDGYDVDHIDGDRRNNDLSNLRYVPHVTNTRNRTQVRAKSGKLGVTPNGSGWMALIEYGGVTKYLGTYRTVEEAADARIAFEKRVDYRGLEGV